MRSAVTHHALNAPSSGPLPAPRIAQRGSRPEVEAHRLATEAAHKPMNTPLANRISRSSPHGGEHAAAQDLNSQVQPAAGPGAPLEATDRAAMETRFGVDFSRVRIHADTEAAQDARDLKAYAFNWGPHLFFGAGRYQPGSARTRQLLTHELVHVVQQGAHESSETYSDVIFRADEAEAIEEEPMQESDPVPQLIMSISTEAHKGFRYVQVNPGQDVELGEVLSGDVFSLLALDENRDNATGLHWEVPNGLEQIQQVGTHGMQFRVTGAAHAADRPETVEIGLEGLREDKVIIRLQIAPMPKQPEAIDPELEANVAERQTLRQERKTARQSFRDLPREERKAQRSVRSDERKAFRRRAGELRREGRRLRRQNTFKLANQRTIEKAMLRAVQVVRKALTRLNAGANDPGVQAALTSAMRWGNSNAGEQDREAYLTRIIDTLTVARNNMLLITHETFDNGSGCDERTGAYVAKGARGGQVFLCPLWLRGAGLKFGCAGNNLDEARAYALLHEFIHLAGPSASNEKYVDDGTWQGLKLEETLNMADGYACLAWKLAQGATR